MPAAKFCSKATSNCISVSLFAALQAGCACPWVIPWLRRRLAHRGAGKPDDSYLFVFFFFLSFKQLVNQEVVLSEQK